MKTRLINLWGSLRVSFWLLPSLITLLSIVLAFVLVHLDEHKEYESLQNLKIFYDGAPEGARAMLTTIAGSMITIAGVTFSITIVALTLASSQFGSRLLRNFMRDTSNQFVLGTFIGTFIYCLLVLQVVRGTSDFAFVPKISVTFSMVLALTSLGVLIYFIHHVATSIQADSVIEATYRELKLSLERVFPSEKGERQADLEDQLQYDKNIFDDAHCIPASLNGYLQAVDLEGLMELIKKRDYILKIEYQPGDYVIAGSPLIQVQNGDNLPDDIIKKIKEAFIIGIQRTPEQDPEFAINQLVEIAVKALSPGINDPFTAIACIDRLGAALCEMVQRTFPSPYMFDSKGQLRIVTKPFTLWKITKRSFDQIRQYGSTSVSVTIRLLDVLIQVAGQTQDTEHHSMLHHHASMIERGSQHALSEQHDRNDVHMRYRHLLSILKCA